MLQSGMWYDSVFVRKNKEHVHRNKTLRNVTNTNSEHLGVVRLQVIFMFFFVIKVFKFSSIITFSLCNKKKMHRVI